MKGAAARSGPSHPCRDGRGRAGDRWRCRPPDLQFSLKTFYESDRRGRTSSPLTACGFCRWQSASVVAGGGVVLLRGTRRSLVLHHSPRLSSRSIGRLRKRVGRTTRNMVLSETRHACPLPLLQVLRACLWLEECLGVTTAGWNALTETVPAPSSANLEPPRVNAFHSRRLELRLVARAVSFAASYCPPVSRAAA